MNLVKIIFYDKSQSWGEKIANITDVERNKDGQIVAYFIDGHGWVDKNNAIDLAMNGDIDNVVMVNGRNGIYLRSRPDNKIKNNFSKMGRS